jgi:hypothetical protein
MGQDKTTRTTSANAVILIFFFRIGLSRRSNRVSFKTNDPESATTSHPLDIDGSRFVLTPAPVFTDFAMKYPASNNIQRLFQPITDVTKRKGTVRIGDYTAI